jgi:hypothetical protein
VKLLVCGSRTWFQRPPIYRELSKFQPGTVVIHGNAIGADAIADNVARALRFIVRPYPAAWKAFGNKAGPLRNREMLIKEHLNEEPIDLVLAFAQDFSQSRGTQDMVQLAERVGITVHRFIR